MKKLFLRGLMLCSAILLFNCQNEDITEESHQEQLDIAIERKSFNEFHDLPELVSKHVIGAMSESFARGGSTDPLYDFEIDSTSVTQIIKEGKTFYTMAIYREASLDNSFENLVISNEASGNEAYIIRYFPSQEYLQSLENNVHAPFIGEINITPLDYSQLMNRGDIVTCYSFTQAFCGNGPAGTAAGPGCANHSDGGAHVQTRTITFCIETTYQTQIIEDPQSPPSGGINDGNGNNGGGVLVPPSDSTPIVTEPVRLFAERQFVMGLSPEQKLWWNNPENSDERQELINYIQNNNSSEESKAFAKWAIDYLRANPFVTIEQFKNWFMSRKADLEDTSSSNLSSLNLNFPTQTLPSFDDFILAYPSELDPNFDTPQKIYTSVGGAVLAKYNQGARNTCALRVSRALNNCNINIPNIPGVTVKGADNKNYFLVAKNLLYWMKKTFGTPTGNNHLTGSQGGTRGENFINYLRGKEGIYIMIPNDPSLEGFNASGHADLFFSDMCDNDCYFNATGGVSEIFFWELP